MKLELHDAGVSYQRDWVFRRLTYTFEAGKTYAILGPNGSGKSTLLKALSGHLGLHEGRLEASLAGKEIDKDNLFRHLTIAAPYVELVEEFTVAEMVRLHYRFKLLYPGFSEEDVVARVMLTRHRNKALRHLSSGMRQRLKVGLALLSDTPLVLLDEPATNLDASGITWYRQLRTETESGRLVIIASNREEEYSGSHAVVDVMEYKG